MTTNAALALLALVYFATTWVALVRGHPNGVPIFLVNLLLGWTLLGWVAALVWSTLHFERRRT
jgi:hypothetical protein